MSSNTLKVLQVLPALNSGGVERGTMEFARALVDAGHESIVLSSGGLMVEKIEKEGSLHISMPVHRKSLRSLFQVRPMRALIQELQPDIVHVRSRVPAWIVWLAWRKLPEHSRPALVSTFHGMYSVNFYSAVMARAEHTIAISDCVYDYMTTNYPIDPKRITKIYRGLDPDTFHKGVCTPEWKRSLLVEYPQLQAKKIILMPGRLSRWKGQEAFLAMMAELIKLNDQCHGVIVGGAEPSKEHYLDELLALRDSLGLQKHITLVGHRSDINAFYEWSDVTCHMSNKAEPFGRTVPEALATGTPVVAYERGGASESLKDAFPQGLVPADNISAFAHRVSELLTQQHTINLPDEFYLSYQANATIDVYKKLLLSKRSSN